MEKQPSKRNITVLDNNGLTYDRYTIIDRKTGDVYGASTDPCHPQGVGTYSHNIVDQYMNVSFGYSWRKHCDVEKCIKERVRVYLSECDEIGKRVKLSDLPKNVIKYINQILS